MCQLAFVCIIASLLARAVSPDPAWLPLHTVVAYAGSRPIPLYLTARAFCPVFVQKC